MKDILKEEQEFDNIKSNIYEIFEEIDSDKDESDNVIIYIEKYITVIDSLESFRHLKYTTRLLWKEFNEYFSIEKFEFYFPNPNRMGGELGEKIIYCRSELPKKEKKILESKNYKIVVVSKIDQILDRDFDKELEVKIQDLLDGEITSLKQQHNQLKIQIFDSNEENTNLKEKISILEKENKELKEELFKIKSEGIPYLPDRLEGQKTMIKKFPPFEKIKKFSDYATARFPNRSKTGFYIPKEKTVALEFFENFPVYEQDSFSYTWRELEEFGLVSTTTLDSCDRSLRSRLEKELSMNNKSLKNLLTSDLVISRKKRTSY